MKRLALALISALAGVASAHAIEYKQVRAEQSRIGFAYQQMGVPMEGSFSKFSSRLSFDPAAPARAQVSIQVDLASINTGFADGDNEVGRETWLNTRTFPTAHFESSTVKALGDNRFELAGKLMIKGTSRDVLVPATFTTQNGLGVFDGSLRIQRGDFSIGEGGWKSFDIVANDVVITFHLTVAAD